MVELALIHTTVWFLLAAAATRLFIFWRFPLAMRRAPAAEAIADADDDLPGPVEEARLLARIFSLIAGTAAVSWALFVFVPRLGSAALTVLGS